MIMVSSMAGMDAYLAGSAFTDSTALAAEAADFSSALHVVEGAGALNSGGISIGAPGIGSPDIGAPDMSF